MIPPHLFDPQTIWVMQICLFSNNAYQNLKYTNIANWHVYMEVPEILHTCAMYIFWITKWYVSFSFIRQVDILENKKYIELISWNNYTIVEKLHHNMKQRSKNKIFWKASEHRKESIHRLCCASFRISVYVGACHTFILIVFYFSHSHSH
jgi:hypothetical protein